MIETIDEAIAALRQHGKFCQLLVCPHCDENADVADMLGVIRPLLELDRAGTRIQRDEELVCGHDAPEVEARLHALNTLLAKSAEKVGG